MIDPNPPIGMALIPAGTCQMGDTFSEGFSFELPVHEVYVNEFYMDQYEVSKGLWDEVYQWATSHGYSFDHPGAGNAANHPVQTVSWYDVVKWCNARSEKEGRIPAYYTDAALSLVYKKGRSSPRVRWNAGYRLPTEAEWEKAARGGGSGHRFPWTDADTITHGRANYSSNSSFSYDISPTPGFHPAFNNGVYPYTSPLGSFAPNGYGLYDMTGNVWEWCWDWYGSYLKGPQTDPRGPATGSDRVFRGGSWRTDGGYCRSAQRDFKTPGYQLYNVGSGPSCPQLSHERH